MVDGIISKAVQGAIGNITDDGLRERVLREIAFLINKLEREVAEPKAKIPPDNMTDIGPCFMIKLVDDSMSIFPYCPKCRTVMPKSGLVFYECHCGFKINGHVLDEAQHALQAARSLPQA